MNNRESDRVKLTRCDKVEWVNNAIMQVTRFLNGSMFNLSFCCNIILYLEKVTLYEKFSKNLTLEVQKNKNCKTFYEV